MEPTAAGAAAVNHHVVCCETASPWIALGVSPIGYKQPKHVREDGTETTASKENTP